MMLFKKWIGKCLSFVNYYYKTTSIFHDPAKLVLQPSYVVAFSPSEASFLTLCAHSFNYQVDYSLGFRQKEVFSVPLQQVTFLGNSGALIKKDKMVIESVFDPMRMVKSPAFRSFAWMKQRTKKEGLYTSVMHLPWADKSNYHWFLDCLPRLYPLLAFVPEEPIQVIVPDNLPAFQLETLKFLLQDKEHYKVVPIRSHEKWHIANFIFPSFVSNHNSGYLPAPLLNNLRASIWKGYEVSNSTERKRIFISRSKASKRRIVNEDALIQQLLPLGFQVVLAENLSYKQQVQLFYNAEWVIAPHGAGLTNILFSKQCTVWELHPADLVKSHYFLLCKALSFHYYYTIGTQSDNNLDFSIDEELFTKQLHAVFSPAALPE